MLAVSENFKNAMKEPVKELQAYITGDIDIRSEDDLISFKISSEAGLGKTSMRKLEAKYLGEHNLLGQNVHVGFGVRLSDGTFEYLDYGSFLVTEITTVKDTGVTNIVGYDKMVDSMKNYQVLDIEYPINLIDYTKRLCEACGLELGNEFFSTVESVSGVEPSTSNADEGNAKKLIVYGNSEQETTEGNQLLDLGNPSSVTNNTTYTFENDTLSVVSTTGSYRRLLYNMLDLIKSNAGKTLYFKCDDYNFANGNNVGVTLVTNDGTNHYNTLQDSKGDCYSYVIPSDVSSITECTVNFFTNNTSTSGGYSASWTKPILSFVENAEYEPYTNGASPNPSYPQDIKVVKPRNILNLLDFNFTNETYITNKQSNSLTITSTDAIAWLNSNANITDMLEVGKTYTVSGAYDDPTHGFMGIDEYSGNTRIQNGVATITVVEGNTYILKLYANRTNTIATGTVVINYSNIQLEEGDKSTDYAPYGHIAVRNHNGNRLKNVTEYQWASNGGTYEKLDDCVKINMPETPSQYSGSYIAISNGRNSDLTRVLQELQGKEVTYSFYAKADENRSIRVGDCWASTKLVDITTEWKRYSLTGRLTSVNALTFYCGASLSTASYYIKDLMLEEGNELTDYRPREETVTYVDMRKPTLIDISNSTPYTYSSGLPANPIAGATINSLTKDSFNITYSTTAYVGLLTPIYQLKPNTIYTISFNRVQIEKTQRLMIYNYDNDTYNININKTSGVYGNYQLTFTTGSTGKIAFMFALINQSNGYTDNISNIRLCEGVDTGNFYELVELNDIKDEFNIVNGKLTQKICKVIYDGTENNWAISTGGLDTNVNYYFSDNTITRNMGTTTTNFVLSTHFLNKSIWSTDDVGIRYEGSASGNSIRIRAPFTTLADFKAWLKEQYDNGTPVTAYYILSTPYEHQLSPVEVPLFQEINNISLLATLETELDLTYPTKDNKMDYWLVDKELWENIDGITYRDIFTQIAQATGTVCVISSDDKVYFKMLKDTGETLTYDNMFKLKLEPKYGEINSVVLSRTPQEDNIYLRDEESIELSGLTEFRIENNEIVDKNREEAITPIFEVLEGTNYFPFETSTEGLGYFEIGDNLNIINDTGDTFNVSLFNFNITMDGSLKETLKASAETKTQTQYQYATSIAKRVKNTEIITNKQEQWIQALISDMYEEDGVVNENYTKIYQDITNIVNSVQNSGGGNIIKNSVMFAYDTDKNPNDWDVTKNTANSQLIIDTNTESLNAGCLSGHSFTLLDAKCKQRVTVNTNTAYTFSTKIKKALTGTCYVKIYNDNEEYIINLPSGESAFYKEYEIQNIKPTDNYYDVEFYGSSDSEATFTDNMFSVGEYKSQWTQANGEIMNTQVIVNENGVLVKSSIYLGDYTVMSPLEFAGYSNISGTITKVFSLNKDTTEVTKLKAEKEISMSPIKIVPITSGDLQGWAFVPDNREV